MVRALSCVAAAALGLAGCATSYESRLRNTFMDAGLSRSVSGCMADRLVDRLSESQLRSLVRLTGIRDRDVRGMTVEEFLRRSRALVDTSIYVEVTRVGLGCAIAG
jgi:hypothetical protein